MEDEKIIDLFFERSESAISSLSEKYGNVCKLISYNITKNEMDAQECVNDTYFAVWESIPPERPKNLGAYIFKLARNLSITRYRNNTAQKRNSFYDQPLEELEECIQSSGKVDDNLEVEELTKAINKFLETLRPLDRTIFMERFWFCYEISEIMNNHNITNNYVNVHLYRVKDKLKKYLQKEGYLNE